MRVQEVEQVPAAEPRRRGRQQNTIGEVISQTDNMSMLINCPVVGSSTSPTPSSPSPASSPGFRHAFPVADFLDRCFLCRSKLSLGKDIYMYRGDTGFCSEECRCRQILLEEEEEAFRR